MALGARTSDVLRLVLRESAVMLALGIAAGLAGAAAHEDADGAYLARLAPLG